MNHTTTNRNRLTSRRSNKPRPLPKYALVMNLCGRCLKNWMDSGRYRCRRMSRNPDDIKDYCVFCDTRMGFEYALIPIHPEAEKAKSHIGQNLSISYNEGGRAK